MIDLGNFRGKLVTTNDEALHNKHIAVIGSSGSGKTVQCQRMFCSAVEQGCTVLALDLHGALADDQIFWNYRPIFEQYGHEIDAHSDGIKCPLFSPVRYGDGSVEDSIDTVGSITDVLATSFRLGCAQAAELRSAVRFVYDSGGYETQGIRALDYALRDAGSVPAQRVREKLYFLTEHNIFRPGDKLFCEQKINIFRLSKFSRETQQTVAEMLLAYVWRLANAGEFKANPIYIFVDECQNLSPGKDSALAQMLSEGRKFGVNLILATQLIQQGAASAVQQRISQCGLMLYFKPAANLVGATARMIDSKSESDWSRLLRTLEVGEFIADGDFLIDGREHRGALKVSAIIKDSE